MKKLRVLLSLVFLCLIAVPISAHAAELMPVQKSLSSNIITSSPPSGIRKSFSLNPGDYPLKVSNTYVDSLLDSWGTYHDFTFKSVVNYSATEMYVQMLYQCDYYILYKDSYIAMEFYKNNAGTLQSVGKTNFDTSGYRNVLLNSYMSKATFQGQPYIFIRIGVSEYPGWSYLDSTQFKVVNPFYTPPDKTPPAKPIVYTVDNNDKGVSGKAEAYSTIIVKNGSTTLGTNKANSNGYFTVTIPTQKAGTKLTVYAKDAAGNQSSGTTVTVLDKTPPAKPAVNSIGDNQTIINGKTEGYARVEVKQGTTLIGQITAPSSGYYTIKLTSVKKAGTVLTFYAIDRSGNRSAGNAVKVSDVTLPGAPTVNKVTYTSTSITGKAEAGAGVYIFYGSNLIGQATSDRYGNYKAAITAQKRGIKLEVLVIDNGGNQSSSTWATVY